MDARDNLLSEVRRAVGHLDNPAYLENLPLARRLKAVAQSSDLSRGQALRRTLRLAIAALDPGPEAPTSEALPYQVLFRYAISKRSMLSIANELDISERQAYRQLHRATQALTQILRDLIAPEGSALNAPEGSGSAAALVREELKRLSCAEKHDVDLNRLIAEAIESVRHLALAQGLQIRFDERASGLQTTANRVMLRQAILNLLSHAVRTFRGGTLDVTLSRRGEHAALEFPLGEIPSQKEQDPDRPYALGTQLCATLGVTYQCIEAHGRRLFSLDIPLTPKRTVLIVDDNAGLLQLFTRYLQGQPYCVFGASNAADAFTMLETLQPDVAIIDVMMPEQDGWELLQLIRGQGVSNRTRLIVCSIINDPQLSLALGADLFLHKPVDRATLLDALHQVLSAGA